MDMKWKVGQFLRQPATAVHNFQVLKKCHVFVLFKFFWPKTHVKFSKTTVFCTSKSQKLRVLSSIVHRPRLFKNVYKIQSIVHRVFTLDRPYTLFVQYSSKVRPYLRYGVLVSRFRIRTVMHRAIFAAREGLKTGSKYHENDLFWPKIIQSWWTDAK